MYLCLKSLCEEVGENSTRNVLWDGVKLTNIGLHVISLKNNQEKINLKKKDKQKINLRKFQSWNNKAHIDLTLCEIF